MNERDSQFVNDTEWRKTFQIDKSIEKYLQSKFVMKYWWSENEPYPVPTWPYYQSRNFSISKLYDVISNNKKVRSHWPKYIVGVCEKLQK